MSLRFGTSGVRGLVTEMTDLECYLYAKAFAQYLLAKSESRQIALAGDLRSSTPRIMRAVGYAFGEMGFGIVNCGHIATPAVAAYALGNSMASIMVTGSHIPDDRNGIKFYMPWGEVLKPDEQAMSQNYAALKDSALALVEIATLFTVDGAFLPGVDTDLGEVNPQAEELYCQRFTEFFGGGSFSGMRILFYQHSSVSRDILPGILQALGADVINLGWSDSFVPVDTEAVAEPERLAAWVREYQADALISTDGDGDRPLVVDETGNVVRGDILGILTARFLQATAVCTPVSCNTAVEKGDYFAHVARTRIGSPYVIAAMNDAAGAGYRSVVGYEANGGFLTGSDFMAASGQVTLPALPTRDALLPIIAPLVSATQQGKSLSALVGELPERYTASGLLRPMPWKASAALIERFETGGESYASELFSELFGPVTSLDFTDGPRITFESGDIVHLRPSGNAPEFRCYTEAGTEALAAQNNDAALEIIAQLRASQ